MTFSEVFRFEVEYRLRQPSTWVYALVLVGLPFLLMHAIDGSRQYLNAPQMIANASTILGSLGMLVTAGIFGDAAARDVQMRMHSLFYTAPIRKWDYLGGRFLGALTVNLTLVLGVPLGLLLASVMPYMSAGKFGPVLPMAYVQAYVLLLVPNVVLIGTFMFAAAALTRQTLATYLGGLALFALGQIAARFANGQPDGLAVTLVDPFGARAMAQAMQYWTAIESNTRLLGWPAILLWNRALWLAISIAVFALFLARFRFAHEGGGGRRSWWSRRVVIDTAPDRIVPISAPHATGSGRSFTFAARARQTVAVAMRAWREIAATRAFLVILAGALFFVFAYGWDVGSEIFGTSTWPVTHLIAGTVLSSALGPVMALLIAIFAGELVWRERDAGMGDIAAVAPIPNSVALLGRFLALVAMLVTLQAVLMAAGVALQAMRDYHRYEFHVYVKLLFGIKLVDYVLLAALAMAIHVVVNHKYVGHLVVVLYFVSTMLSGVIGLRHQMLVYGSDPGWIWSDMNGLSPFLVGIVWFKLYWAAWAILLAVLASLFWVRGRERDMSRRFALARQRLNGPALRAVAVAAVLVTGLGGFVFYNTNVLNEYRSADEVIEQRVAYERRYKRFEHVTAPSLVAANTRVELYPAERRAELHGTFTLVNRTTQPIDSLHVGTSTDVATRTLSFSRATSLVVDDSVLHYRIYALARALAPGDSIAMTFDVTFHPQGFRNEGTPTALTPNGAYIDRSWLPSLGYRPSREITDDELRRANGLPARTPPPSAGDVDAQKSGQEVELVSAETIIGTDARHTAVTPGTLAREWTENGRRYFHYRTDAPTRYSNVIFSAQYAVREDTWRGLPLRVFYHPTHDINVDRMLRSMKSSLEYYSKAFGPYQFKELRVVEFPRYDAFARAHPFTIAFSEGSAFLTRVDSGDIDRTFFVVAHETAHQWWGGQVIPAAAKGASFVSETLAQYSSMMVFETEYGPDMARAFYDYHMHEYFRRRSVFTNREAPLLDVERQNYVYYFKGGLAMYTLRDRLGADTVNAALRRFREKYAGADAPPATSRALYAELQSVTPDSLRPLLSDLFEHITLWNLHADSARTEPAGLGRTKVTLFVDASKARADSVGNQTPTPMDDLVEIGVFATTDSEQSRQPPMYLKQHRIRDGKQTIEIVVSGAPSSAGIDPFHKFIERERDDNFATIRVGSDARRVSSLR